MQRSGLRRIIPIILTVIIIGLLIWFGISLFRTFFGGNSSPSPSPSPTVNVGQQALTNIVSDSGVTMNVRGPIVADENYRTYTVSISQTARSMIGYQGYANKSISDEELGNNAQAYEQLAYALNRANFMTGTPLTGDANDERGICATGTLYEFEVVQGGSSIQKLWTTTCAGSPGSLKANLTQITSLFEVQIPDFSTQLQTINAKT